MGYHFIEGDNDLWNNDSCSKEGRTGASLLIRHLVSHMVEVTETSFWPHCGTKIKINKMPLFRCWWHSGVFILFIRHTYEMGPDNATLGILLLKEQTIGELLNFIRPEPFLIGFRIIANAFAIGQDNEAVKAAGQQELLLTVCPEPCTISISLP